MSAIPLDTERLTLIMLNANNRISICELGIIPKKKETQETNENTVTQIVIPFQDLSPDGTIALIGHLPRAK